MNAARLEARGRIQELEKDLNRINIEAKGNITLIKSEFSGMKQWPEIDIEMCDEQMNRLLELKKKHAGSIAEINRLRKEFDIE